MKKVWQYFVICILLVSVQMSVAAKQTPDSLNLIDDEENLIIEHALDDQIVIKLYCVNFEREFAKDLSIQEVIQPYLEQPTLDAVYALINIEHNHVMFMNVQDGKVMGSYYSGYFQGWKTFYQYAIHPEKVFASSVQVINVYCLDSSVSCRGACIYYVTDQGDYILYRDYVSSQESYLFPARVFYDIAEAIIASMDNGPEDAVGCGPAAGDVWDVEPYRIGTGVQNETPGLEDQEYPPEITEQPHAEQEPENSKKWILYISIGAGTAVLCTAAATILLLRRRKKH